MTARQALEQHLGYWLAVQVPPLPMAWENKPFTVPALPTVYGRTVLMPAIRGGESFCSLSEIGILQVSLYYPVSVGTTSLGAMCESLCAHFAPGTYSGFYVKNAPYYRQGLPNDAGRWFVPVTISYVASV